MAIISFSKDLLVDYIPEYGGNRNSESPCVVRLKYIPHSMVQSYSRIIAARLKNVNDDRRVEVLHEIQKKQFVESVESVSGYFLDGNEVVSPSEFYDTAPSELIYELIKAMESSQKLSEGQRKN